MLSGVPWCIIDAEVLAPVVHHDDTADCALNTAEMDTDEVNDSASLTDGGEWKSYQQA